MVSQQCSLQAMAIGNTLKGMIRNSSALPKQSFILGFQAQVEWDLKEGKKTLYPYSISNQQTILHHRNHNWTYPLVMSSSSLTWLLYRGLILLSSPVESCISFCSVSSCFTASSWRRRVGHQDITIFLQPSCVYGFQNRLVTQTTVRKIPWLSYLRRSSPLDLCHQAQAVHAS